MTRYTAVSCADNTSGTLLSACLVSNTQYPIHTARSNKYVRPMYGTKSATVYTRCNKQISDERSLLSKYYK